MLYEHQNFEDDNLKIIHHIDSFKKGQGFLSHIQYSLELLLIRKGSIELSIDDQTVVVNENEMAVIAPNKIHKGTIQSEYCEYYCLIIDRSFYSDWFKTEDEHFPTKCISETVINAYKSVFSLLLEKPPYYKQEIKAYILLIISHLLRLSDKQDTKEISLAESHRIDMTRNAIIYMYENFAEDISVDDIANAVGFSKYYFCRSFKEITGQTPLCHLNYIRLKNAKALLKSGKSNITETTLKCGFNSTSYFCKLYKKHFGNSPKKDYN